MRFAWIVFAVGFAAGCQEYNISKGPPAYDESLLPPLENPTKVDRIVQLTEPSADVLWVVDNSGSMSDNQNQLANNIRQFMDYFLGSGLDYHIGVVTTDMDNNQQKGSLVPANNGDRYITPDTQDPITVFGQMARVGDTGSGTEQGRAAAYSALEIKRDTVNAGFLRADDQDSGIHVIVISDEDDYSTNSQVPISEFIAYMNGLRASDDLVSFNSIVNPPGGGLLNEPGDKYIQVTQGVGGLWQSLLEDDWTGVLDDLGIEVSGLKREFFLSQLPVVDSLTVQVTDTAGNVHPFDLGPDYSYSEVRNSITFKEYLPDPLSQVVIQYTVLASVVDQGD